MINQHNYNEILESKVFPWVNSKYAGAPYTYQQDGVPAHMAKLGWLSPRYPHLGRRHVQLYIQCKVWSERHSLLMTGGVLASQI